MIYFNMLFKLKIINISNRGSTKAIDKVKTVKIITPIKISLRSIKRVQNQSLIYYSQQHNHKADKMGLLT